MFKAIDDQGNKVKIKARGFLARVFQHETDHLDGQLFTDIAKDLVDMPPEEMTKEQKRKESPKKIHAKETL